MVESSPEASSTGLLPGLEPALELGLELLGALRWVLGPELKPAKVCQVSVIFPDSGGNKPQCLAVLGHLPSQPGARASSQTCRTLFCPLTHGTCISCHACDLVDIMGMRTHDMPHKDKLHHREAACVGGGATLE